MLDAKTTSATDAKKITKHNLLEFIQHPVLGHHFQILQVGDICSHQNPGIQPLLEHLYHSLSCILSQHKADLRINIQCERKNVSECYR